MTYYVNFKCLSCNHTQPVTAIDTVLDHYLSGSICDHCGQVIPTETKRTQLDEHIRLFKSFSHSA